MRSNHTTQDSPIKEKVMSDNKVIIELLCEKLGVERKVVFKAYELCELLEARLGASSLAALRLTGSCKHVICVDLAAKSVGRTLNQADVVKLSSMNKKSYNEAVKVIASMLDLDECLTLRELAVQFGCTGAVMLATDILNRYISHQCSDVDFRAPMFLCAALIVACRKLKIKPDVRKLQEKSGTKKSCLNRLVTELEKHVEKPAAKSKATPTKRKRGLMEAIEAQIDEDDRANKKPKLDETCGAGGRGKLSSADYEEWKRNILAKAAQNSS